MASLHGCSRQPTCTTWCCEHPVVQSAAWCCAHHLRTAAHWCRAHHCSPRRSRRGVAAHLVRLRRRCCCAPVAAGTRCCAHQQQLRRAHGAERTNERLTRSPA
ncbi:hypothetical protein I3843_15G084200 [Carya illinoinensis]|uniref:Uncharacterized protein n=1 Tax=Carya illinoinensis TaxID=32201 RepID=A0A922ABR5_CARIL|nr:hypothetical protein I3842_15G089700 [Carya illinoinensis]KAG7944144.1 hypothetical protein I3843_15G084200 [Carya illinoinensis]